MLFLSSLELVYRLNCLLQNFAVKLNHQCMLQLLTLLHPVRFSFRKILISLIMCQFDTCYLLYPILQVLFAPNKLGLLKHNQIISICSIDSKLAVLHSSLSKYTYYFKMNICRLHIFRSTHERVLITNYIDIKPLLNMIFIDFMVYYNRDGT